MNILVGEEPFKDERARSWVQRANEEIGPRKAQTLVCLDGT
jgi:hypothetical protein